MATAPATIATAGSFANAPVPIDFVWPQHSDPRGKDAADTRLPEEIMPEAGSLLPDPLSLAAVLAPELSRLFGYRIGLKPAAPADAGHGDPAGPGLAEIGRVAVPLRAGGAAGVLLLSADRASLSRLLDRMFGARVDAGPGPDSLAGLPPQSGSWLSLSRLLGEALSRALLADGAILAPAGFVPSARVAPAAEQPGDGLRALDRLLFRLDSGGVGGMLALRQVRVPLAEPDIAAKTAAVAGLDAAPDSAFPVAPDRAEAAARVPRAAPLGAVANRNWGRRARDFALDLDVPVSVHVGEIPMPLEQVARLQPGDILPLSRPRTVAVMVAGQTLASLPAESLGGRRRASDAAMAPADDAA